MEVFVLGSNGANENWGVLLLRKKRRMDIDK